MKGKTDKCHLLLSKDESSEIPIGDSAIESSTCEKLFGIKTDSKLRFDDHIQDVTKLTEDYEHESYMNLHESRYMNLHKKKF